MKYIFVLTLLFLISCSNYERANELAQNVGAYLVNASIDGSIKNKSPTEHPNIATLGSGLKSKLIDMSEGFNSSCYTQVILGGSSVGDSTASHHLFIICDDQKKIGIRLKLDKNKEAFHIMGFWTVHL